MMGNYHVRFLGGKGAMRPLRYPIFSRGYNLTLIVARKIANEIRMYSDARLSYPDQLKNSPLKGALKLVSINDVCIGYAGTYTVAIDALRHIRDNKLNDFGEIVEYLSNINIQSNCDVDFLVATHIPSISIIKIANKEVEFDTSSTWIGDAEAFSEYQRIYHTLPSPPKNEEFSNEENEKYEIMTRMSDALSTLVRENTFDTIGDFTISVRSSNSGFIYLGNAMANIVSQSIPSEIPTTLKFGTAQQGGYAYTVMTPISTNIGAIAVHFHQGNVGALYHPLKKDEAIVYSNVTFENFKESVNNDYGFKIDGVKIS